MKRCDLEETENNNPNAIRIYKFKETISGDIIQVKATNNVSIKASNTTSGLQLKCEVDGMVADEDLKQMETTLNDCTDKIEFAKGFKEVNLNDKFITTCTITFAYSTRVLVF